MTQPLRCIVLGAAGRDFHDVQTFFRTHPGFFVVAITAAQIPYIASRSFPRELAGPAYDADIPIVDEERLVELIRAHDVDFVFLSYSDLSHVEVMHKASIVEAAGASFALLGPKHTQLPSRRPVIAVTASRTGAGKSPITQAIARHLRAVGHRVGVLRHPMPYGVLRAQVVQRFATPEDFDRHQCTIEEREEYAPYVAMGMPIFAGVDYARVLAAAEDEADVILWDGGNNDYPFVRPDLWITVVDALRPGHEVSYHPGETNLRAADVVVVAKVGRARPEDLLLVEKNVAMANPRATVLHADLEVRAEPPSSIAGKRVLVVEDGPTVTHGGMSFGAGTVAARAGGAAALIDPRPFARGSIAEAYQHYPHLGAVLPALGYSEAQRRDLAETILAAAPEVVVDGSPAGVIATLHLDVPCVRALYGVKVVSGPALEGIVDAKLAQLASGRSTEKKTHE
jgi:predicted GTPase